MVNNQILERTNMRPLITPADLWVLLDREFRRRRPRECAQCTVPMPFRVDAPDGASNWEMDIRACGARCALILEELVESFRAKHDLTSS